MLNSLNQYTQITNGGLRNLSYDWDGNLTNDSKLAYSWDAENRLTKVEPVSPSNGSKRVEFAYDYMSRRYSKKVYSYSTTNNYQLTTETKFLWDGWAMVSEVRSQSSEVRTNYYVYGLDLSGSIQGAGTIGGLLSAQLINPSTSNLTTTFYCYDGNGNVCQLIGTNGAIVALYAYDPFGDTLTQTGTLASENLSLRKTPSA